MSSYILSPFLLLLLLLSPITTPTLQPGCLELGLVRGQYAYLDPNYKWQQVQYVADDEGFHVDSSNLPVANVDTPAVANAKANHAALFQQIAASHTLGADGVVIPVVGPQDSASVAQAKAQHAALFGRIAASNSQAPVAIVRRSPPETPIVQDYRNRFSEEFARIAEEHARIAEEHAIMAEQEAREREIAEGKLKATN